MLQEGCVSERLLILARKLEGETIFKDYFLVGGTALALQIGHRKSDDIDLFTWEELRIPEITKYLIQRHSKKFQIMTVPFALISIALENNGNRFQQPIQKALANRFNIVPLPGVIVNGD